MRKMDKQYVMQKLQQNNSDIVNKIGNNNAVIDYIDRALLFVKPLNAPDYLINTLVRLYTVHLMNQQIQDNTITEKLGPMTKTVSGNSSDDALDEFNSLCDQYDLKSGKSVYLSGF